MDLTSVIIGPVVTEKAEAQKQGNTYVLKVHPHATKIDVKHALRRFYDVEAVSVRVLRVAPKRRMFGNNKVMEKRHRSKRMIIRLSPKSKTLDLAKFQAA